MRKKPLKTRIKDAANVFLSYGAKEVYLFGSRASGQAHRRSDIDMAISGLPPRVFFRAWADAYDALQMPLDVVDLDEDTSFTRHLRAHGDMVRVA